MSSTTAGTPLGWLRPPLVVTGAKIGTSRSMDGTTTTATPTTTRTTAAAATTELPSMRHQRIQATAAGMAADRDAARRSVSCEPMRATGRPDIRRLLPTCFVRISGRCVAAAGPERFKAADSSVDWADTVDKVDTVERRRTTTMVDTTVDIMAATASLMAAVRC